MRKAIVSTNQAHGFFKSMILDFWENMLYPDQWETSLLKIIPKKGDLSQQRNYRGIMLSDIAYKIVAKIVHCRLQSIVENLDHESQCGFRPG